MLAFLLDIIEVAEVCVHACMHMPKLTLLLTQSHTGANLAAAFQAMLERFGLENKILLFNGDNASQNDTQAVKLAHRANSCSEDNRIRCFNHTMQLSARTLLKPFTKSMSSADDEGQQDVPACDDGQALEDDEDGDSFLHLDELEEVDGEDLDNADDDGVDNLDKLDEEEHEALLEETAVVRDTIAKVCTLLLIPFSH
jgi:hypothetical protein